MAFGHMLLRTQMRVRIRCETLRRNHTKWCTTVLVLSFVPLFFNSFRFTIIASRKFPSLIASPSLHYYVIIASLPSPTSRRHQKVIVSSGYCTSCIDFSYLNILHMVQCISLRCVVMKSIVYLCPKMNFAAGGCPMRWLKFWMNQYCRYNNSTNRLIDSIYPLYDFHSNWETSSL